MLSSELPGNCHEYVSRKQILTCTNKTFKSCERYFDLPHAFVAEISFAESQTSFTSPDARRHFQGDKSFVISQLLEVETFQELRIPLLIHKMHRRRYDNNSFLLKDAGNEECQESYEFAYESIFFYALGNFKLNENGFRNYLM